MSLVEWMELEGFTREADPLLWAYAARWAFNNQFMVMDDPAAFFSTSAGVVEYRATGTIAPED